MIFLTVGTQFPFDRLVKAVDEAAGEESDKAGEQTGADSGDVAKMARTTTGLTRTSVLELTFSAPPCLRGGCW